MNCLRDSIGVVCLKNNRLLATSGTLALDFEQFALPKASQLLSCKCSCPIPSPFAYPPSCSKCSCPVPLPFAYPVSRWISMTPIVPLSFRMRVIWKISAKSSKSNCLSYPKSRIRASNESSPVPFCSLLGIRSDEHGDVNLSERFLFV